MNTKAWIKGALVAVGLPAAAGAAALRGATSGVYNVGATDEHTAPVEWLLRTSMESSVRQHADSVSVPDGIDVRDPALAARAIGHYSVACASCHGSPGAERAPWMVLYPEPTNLTDPAVVEQWSDAELYWIIKHGIKDTGMIALGPTHSEQDLWAVTAFVRQLPGMSEERYQALVADYENSRAHASHRH